MWIRFIQIVYWCTTNYLLISSTLPFIGLVLKTSKQYFVSQNTWSTVTESRFVPRYTVSPTFY